MKHKRLRSTMRSETAFIPRFWESQPKLKDDFFICLSPFGAHVWSPHFPHESLTLQQYISAFDTEKSGALNVKLCDNAEHVRYKSVQQLPAQNGFSAAEFFRKATKQ